MNEDLLRQQLAANLDGKGAHAPLVETLAKYPAAFRSSRGPGVSRTAWQLMEHLRIAQWDILEFTRDPGHSSPVFPDGYWPDEDAPPHDGAWDESVAAFRRDLEAMQGLVTDPAHDLVAPIPHGQGQTILREALLVADHNSYHLGQLVQSRRILESLG